MSLRVRKTKRGLSRVAYEAVVDMIFSRRLPAGAVIQERKLAESLNISRTPMREALGKLEGEGLIVRLTDRLLSVRVVTLEEYLQTLQVRYMLEPEAVAMAVPRVQKSQIRELRERVVNLVNDPEGTIEKHWEVDAAIHITLGDACGNAVLGGAIQHLRTITQLFEIQTTPARALPDCEDLVALLDAVEAGNVAKARKAIKFHLDRARKGVVDEL
jgi:DNA-binding GntR family transcriptional regulator